MKQFQEIDPLTIKNDPRVIAEIADDRDSRVTYYILIDDSHVIIANTTYYTDPDTNQSEWLHYQIEFPKKGLKWYLNTIKNKFFKTEAEGGLKKGQFEIKNIIDGEWLLVGRAMDADGHGGGGYCFYTLDRPRRPGSRLSKKYTFTDRFLFEHGFFDLLQSIADRIEAGEL